MNQYEKQYCQALRVYYEVEATINKKITDIGYTCVTDEEFIKATKEILGMAELMIKEKKDA